MIACTPIQKITTTKKETICHTHRKIKSTPLNTATDAKIRAGLKQLTGMTTIIIAQRLSSVAECDKIIVLDDGKINAVGTHQQLLESCAIYQEVYHSQQKGTVEGGDN